MKDVIIVGAGIIGATVSKALQKAGADVLTLDDGRPKSGTVPSGGHLKPSWFGDMPKTEYEPAMELLDKTWGLIEAQFKVQPSGSMESVFRVDTDAVVKHHKTIATVESIEHVDNFPVVKFTGGEERCRLLVVAAGVWCSELFPQLKIVAKQGVSFRFTGRLESPFINPWAPYKQVVAHQQSMKEVWVGDGSAILPKNWDNGRTVDCLNRCRKALGYGPLRTPDKTLIGIRPYCESGTDPCLLKKIGPRVWIATGAGKSGTIAAGWVARRMLQCLK